MEVTEEEDVDSLKGPKTLDRLGFVADENKQKAYKVIEPNASEILKSRDQLETISSSSSTPSRRFPK